MQIGRDCEFPCQTTQKISEIIIKRKISNEVLNG